MDDFIILVSVQKKENNLSILAYSGDYNSIYEDEMQYCHHYILTFSMNEEFESFNDAEYEENSSIHLDFENSMIYLLNG